MPGLKDMPNEQRIIDRDTPAQGTANTDETYQLGAAPFRCTVTRVVWTPATAVTGAATNHFAFQVVNKGADNSGTGAVTTVKAYASGVNSAVNTPETYTLSTGVNLAAGDVLIVDRTTPGSGLASPAGFWQVFAQVR